MRYFTDSPFERMMMQVPQSFHDSEEQPERQSSGCSLDPGSCGKSCDNCKRTKKEKNEYKTCNR
ncbi:MAG: hypothetical protein VB021_00350 [Oscillospiraceae bacterium]|nr:hypothetical protein [Oscillospiraceae bacterium]